MTDDRDLQKRRFAELARRADNAGIFTFTPFLGLAEQDAYHETERTLPVPATAFGGAEGCERVMLRFGDPDMLGYEEPFPIACLRAAPVSEKFADALTHRDFLGALMNLGIDREVLGDIVLRDNVGYIFADEKIVPYLLSDFRKVKHTDLKVTRADALPEGDLYRTEPILIQAAGERLDAVVSKVFRLSRADAQTLFRRGLVFVNGSLCENTSADPKEGAVVSVRGYGRFRYVGFTSETKKGKLNLKIEKYI